MPAVLPYHCAICETMSIIVQEVPRQSSLQSTCRTPYTLQT